MKIRLIHVFESPSGAAFDEEAQRNLEMRYRAAGLATDDTIHNFQQRSIEVEASSGIVDYQVLAANSSNVSSCDSSTDALISTDGLDLCSCGTAGSSSTVVVAFNITTSNPVSVELILATRRGIGTISNLLGSRPITNAANESFTNCTSRVRFEQGQRIVPATTLLGFIDLGGFFQEPLRAADFLNDTNPVATAVGQLLRRSAATAQVAATAVAASATASAVAGGASGMSPAGLLSVQRLSLYSKMSGVPRSCEDDAARTAGGDWYTGSFGIARNNPCTDPSSSAAPSGPQIVSADSPAQGGGRRLTSQRGKDNGADDSDVQAQEDLPVRLLVNTMIDQLVSAIVLLSVVFGLHMIVLLCWRFCFNRAYYRWQPPGFTRTIQVDKAKGKDLGVSLRRGRVAGIAEDSPCCSVLSSGDKVVLINGKRVARTIWGCFSPFRLSNGGARKRMREASQVILLVTRSPEASGINKDAPRGMISPGRNRVAPDGDKACEAQPSKDVRAFVMGRSAMRRLPERLRAKYEARTRVLKTRPAFHPLPEPFVFPNLELTFGLMCSTGMMQASCAVLAAWASGYRAWVSHVTIAVSAIAFITALFAHQAWLLFIFSRHHNEHTWIPAEKPQAEDELEDPLFRLVTKVERHSIGLLCQRGKMPLITRERGGYEPPEEDNMEPDRTERALSRVFGFWRLPSFRDRPHGDAMAELGTWLGDATGTKHGLWFLYFLTVVQVVLAGFTGVMYALPWATTTVGGAFWQACLLAIAVINLLWTVSQTDNDRIDGIEKLLCFALEVTSIGFLLAGAIIKTLPLDTLTFASTEEERVQFTLDLASHAAKLMLAVVFVPFPISVYNSFVVPIFTFVMKAEGNWRETCAQGLMTLILIPIAIAGSFCGFKSDPAKWLGELEDAIVGAAAADYSVEDDAPNDEEAGEDHVEDPVTDAALKAERAKLVYTRVKKLQSFKRLTTDRKWKTMRELKADGAKGWTMAPIATTTARAQLFGLHAAVSSRYQLLGPQATDIAARGKEPGPVSKATRKRLKREEFVAAQRAKRSRKLMGTSKVHACTAEEMKVSSYDGTPRDIPTCAGTMSTSMAMKDMASKLPSNSPWVER